MGIETGAFRVRVMPRLKISDGLLLKRLPVPRRKQHWRGFRTCNHMFDYRQNQLLIFAVKFHVTMKVDSSIPAGLFDKSAESASSADGLSRSAKKVKRAGLARPQAGGKGSMTPRRWSVGPTDLG